MVRLLIFSLLLWSSCRHDPPVDPASRAAAEEAALAREQARLDSIRTAAISAYLDSITRALPAQPIPLADLYERASEGVYLILSVNDYGEVAQGTGFLINANGLLVTNYHVVEDMVEGAVVYEPGKFVMIDRVIRQDTVRDWAVIRVMPGLPPGVVLPVAREMPRVGEEVFTIGNPKGLAQTLSTGIISGYRGEDQLIQTTAEITHGSVAGPSLIAGEVIGITTMGLGEANLNFAVNISRLKIDDLLDHPVPGRTVSPVLPYHGRVRAYLEAYYRARMSGEADQLSACYAPKVMQHFEILSCPPRKPPDWMRISAGPAVIYLSTMNLIGTGSSWMRWRTGSPFACRSCIQPSTGPAMTPDRTRYSINSSWTACTGSGGWIYWIDHLDQAFPAGSPYR